MGVVKEMPDAWRAHVDRWAEALAEGGRRPSTVRQWRSRIYAFARAAGAPPERVAAADVEAWIGRPGVGGRTRREDRNVLRAFFAWAAGVGLVARSPVTRADPHEGGRSAAMRVAPQFDLVEPAMRSTDGRTALMVSLAAECGLTAREIAGLRPVDLTDDGTGWCLMVDGRRGDRMVPVCDATAARIRAAIHPGGYVFPGGSGGGHVSEDTVQRIIRDATGCAPTDLRRMAAVRIHRASRGDLAAVALFLGVGMAAAWDYVRADLLDDASLPTERRLREAVDAICAHRRAAS